MTRNTSLQIPWTKPEFWGDEQQYVTAALRSTWISGGPYVEQFEHELARFLGIRFACAVANGTAALHAAYLGIGIQRGDEIVVPGFAFMAAANIALHMGAVPVFAEVDRDTWCVTAETIERCVSARIKAIVVVHSYGNVCDMQEILALGRARGVPVIEDAAEAFASRYRGRFAGTLATIGTYSFQATKTITTGEGGMTATDDPAIHERIALFRNHGMLRKRYYWHEVPGFNFRLTNLQAALGCAQFAARERIFAERRRVYDAYRAQLAGIPGVRMQQLTAGVEPIMWAVAACLGPVAYPQGRDAVMAQMLERGIETRPGFYAASLMPHLYASEKLPVCEELSRQVISLPTYPTLSDSEIVSICTVLNDLRLHGQPGR